MMSEQTTPPRLMMEADVIDIVPGLAGYTPDGADLATDGTQVVTCQPNSATPDNYLTLRLGPMEYTIQPGDHLALYGEMDDQGFPWGHYTIAYVRINGGPPLPLAQK